MNHYLELYDLDQKVRAWMEQTDDDGIITDEAVAAIGHIHEEIDDTLETLALLAKELTANAKAIKHELQSLEKRAKACDANAARFKNILASYLSGHDRPRLKTTRCFVNVTTVQAVRIDDIASIPPHLCRITKEPDKVAIAQWLKADHDVPGARLEDRPRVTIR